MPMRGACCARQVRGAVFNMVSSLYGCAGGLPEEARWLDLFAGTGAIGIEALSRGEPAACGCSACMEAASARCSCGRAMR